LPKAPGAAGVRRSGPLWGRRMTAAARLPQPVAEEILRRYADVLRVGSLEVNGEIVKWMTDTSTELQLRHFCDALFDRLRQLKELSQASDDVLRQASYWVCKAVSINYALIEVLLLVKRKVGVMCTIETRDDAGGLVSYSIEARPTQVMHIRLSWRGKNNIVYRDPHTAAKKVKGTLSCLETEFCLPPAQRFAPSYRLQMKFERSMAAKFVSTVTCRDTRSADGVYPVETILIEDPLHSDHPLEIPQALARVDAGQQARSPSAPSGQGTQSFDVTALEPLDIDDFCEGLRMSPRSLDGSPASTSSSPLRRDTSTLPPSSPYSTPLKAEPRSFTARSVRLPPPIPGTASAAGADAPPVGQLRVRVLRARGLARRRHAHGDPSASVSEPYCRISVGGRTEVTRPSTGNCPEWREEALDFPVLDGDLRGEVLLEVCDGAGREHALLGWVRVPVSTVLSNGGKASLTEPLNGAGSGSLELELELLTESPDLDDPYGDCIGDALGPDECLVEVGTIPPSVSMNRRFWAV